MYQLQVKRIMPDPRLEKRQRRRFSAEQKRRILEEVEACSERGQVAAIVRREGLYASQLSACRRTSNVHLSERRRLGGVQCASKQGQKDFREEVPTKSVGGCRVGFVDHLCGEHFRAGRRDSDVVTRTAAHRALFQDVEQRLQGEGAAARAL